MMRVNPNLNQTLVDGLDGSQQQINKYLQQLSSGQRVNTLSDDPEAAALMVQNRKQSQQADQFIRNIDSLKTMLSAGDSALSSVVTALNQAISLGVQGASGTLSTQQRQQLAQQVAGIQQQVLSAANTQVQGTYIFAGSNVDNPAFVANSSSPSGVTYQGNSQVNTVELTPGSSSAVNQTGDVIFANPSGNVFQSLQDLTNALNSGNNIGAAVTSLQAAYSNVSEQRVFYGQTLNTMDSSETYLNQEKVDLSSQANTLIGADLAQTESNYVQSQTGRDALLAAGGRISQLTLLDYLK